MTQREKFAGGMIIGFVLGLLLFAGHGRSETLAINPTCAEHASWAEFHWRNPAAPIPGWIVGGHAVSHDPAEGQDLYEVHRERVPGEARLDSCLIVLEHGKAIRSWREPR